MKALERVAIVLVSLALAAGLIAVLSGFFASRDTANLSGGGTAQGPGQSFPDQGDGVLARGDLRPPYDSNPPTSGAHVPETVGADGVPLNDDQLLSALSRGNVVLFYGRPELQPPLRALATSVAGQFSAALAATGQAVIVAPRAGTSGVVAVAWDHLLSVSQPADPRLRQFADYWLGRVALSP